MKVFYKIIIAFFGWLLAFASAYTQNLVPNPSFETYTACPTGSSQIYDATPWTGPTYNSTDYLNVCSSLMGIPNAGVGYQYARTGNAYAGFWGYEQIGGNYREYLQAPLMNALVGGKCYYIKFYTNLLNGNSSNNIGAINNIAAHISNVTYATTASSGNVLSLVPHALKFGNPIIKDTLDWVEVSGIFTATGGEDHIIIGNFKDDAQTDTSANYYSSFSGGAYYYIDDVSVIAVDSMSIPPEAGNDTSIVLGDSVFIGQQLYGLNCNWYSNSVLIASNISGIYVKPNTLGTHSYVVEQNLCGNITYDTVVVTVNPVGIEAFKNNALFKVYPNPANTIINLELGDENGVVDIKMNDVLGNEVRNEKAEGKKHLQIDVSDLQNGIYFVSIRTAGNLITKKIIVQQ